MNDAALIGISNSTPAKARKQDAMAMTNAELQAYVAARKPPEQSFAPAGYVRVWENWGRQ